MTLTPHKDEKDLWDGSSSRVAILAAAGVQLHP